MASDLIPPPSPAGRPELAGTTTHRFVELPPEEPTVEETPPPPVVEQKLPPSRFRNRFGFLMGALGGVLLASVGMAVAIALWSDNGTAAGEGLHKNWSKWQPSDSSMPEGAVQIAEKVGKEYKHPNGNQLVLVQPTAIEQGLKVALVAGAITQIEGPAVVYEMNGLGENGSIKEGKASNERGQLLQREALELSLYTFRYLPDAEMVVVMLPPPPPEAADAAAAATGTATASTTTASGIPKQRAIFFRPGDLKSQLQVPLGVTVPAKAPTEATLTATEAKQIDSLTRSNRFTWEIQPNQGIMVLKPLPTS